MKSIYAWDIQRILTLRLCDKVTPIEQMALIGRLKFQRFNIYWN